MYAVTVHGVAGAVISRPIRFGVLPAPGPTSTNASRVIVIVAVPWFSHANPVSLGAANGRTGPNVSHVVPVSRASVNPSFGKYTRPGTPADGRDAHVPVLIVVGKTVACPV